MNERRTSPAETQPLMGSPFNDPTKNKKDARQGIDLSGWRIWALLGVISLVAVWALMQFLLLPPKGWQTLKVENATPGSQINGKNQGIPTTDGKVVLPYRKHSGDEKSVPDGFRLKEIGNDRTYDNVAVVTTQVSATPTPMPTPPPDMVFVKGGAFLMGREGEQDNPPREVYVEDFFIDQFEVTNAQYKKFCDQQRGGRYPPNSWKPSYFNEQPDAPVVGISWDDANEYALWIRKRLPKEKEWEKAASWDPNATDVSIKWKYLYPWGNQPIQSNAQLGQKGAKLVSVTAFPTDNSRYQVRGMAGNASEWVDGTGTEEGLNIKPAKKVVRGGSCSEQIKDARVTIRLPWNDPDQGKADWVVGFRCAISVKEYVAQRSGQ